MALQDKVIDALIKQQEKGSELESDIHDISNSAELENLIQKYDFWNDKTSNLLNEAFVHKQLYRMFSGVVYLGNVNIDENSFQGKRDKLIYCVPRKMAHLKTAILNAGGGRSVDFLPFDEKVYVDNIKIENQKMKKLFISHSSKDDLKVKPLIDLIEGIGVTHSQIFYSSHPAYGVGLGQNIFERLKTELSDEVFALFMLSENFYSSPVCLCEMGAVWIKSNKQIPILIPPFKFENIEGVFPNSLGFKIDDRAQLNSFKSELETYFELSPIHFTRWEEKRDDYLSKIGSLI